MSGSISWEEFEAIIFNLEKSFADQGVVTKNEVITGFDSETKRQIDIVVRAKISGEEMLIIIECKRWTRKVDVKAVEAFVGVKADVRAHLGIMVSTRGFTAAARRLADKKGIKLYRYEDSLKQGWPSGVETYMMLECWELTPTAAYFILDGERREEITSDEQLNFTDVHSREERSLPLASVLRKMWENMPSEEQFERSWVYECACTTPERPDIQRIGLGAISKLIRGYKVGRLLFEGQVDDHLNHAKVMGWKMVYSGDLIPLEEIQKMPNNGSLCISTKHVHVKTLDPKSEVVHELIKNGIVEVTVSGEKVFNLPIGS